MKRSFLYPAFSIFISLFAFVHPSIGYSQGASNSGTNCVRVTGDSSLGGVTVCDPAPPNPGSERPPTSPARGDSPGAPVTSPADPSAACLQRYQSMRSSCETRVESAGNACDSSKDTGMKGVMSKAAQIATVLGAMTASNVNSSCNSIANLSQAANAAVAAYRLNCSNSVNSCVNTCQDMLDYVKQNTGCLGDISNEADGVARGCAGFDRQIAEANQAIQNYAQTTANAAQCNLDSKGMDTYCEQNPGAMGCSNQATADCSDPAQATTNKVCICAANPYSMECAGAQNASSDLNPGAGSGDYSSRLKSAQGEGGYSGDDIPGLPSIEQAALNKKPGQDISGRQGAGNPISGAGGAGGGGGGAARGGTGGGAPGEPNGSAVNAGFYGGGGKFGRGGGGAAGGAGAGGLAPGANRGFASTANPQGPDLRKFLPGGAYDPKRLSGGTLGMTGKDGITGPHTNIWMKIQNRYRVMSPTLLP